MPEIRPGRPFRWAGNPAWIGWALILMVIWVVGCSPSRVDRIDSGQVQVHTPGFPNFSLTTYNEFDDEYSGALKVELEIPFDNLYFSQIGGETRSAISMNISIERQHPEDEDRYRTLHNDVYEDTITVDTTDAAYRRENYGISSLYQVGPGNYRISAIVRDHNSNKQILRRQMIEIPALDTDKMAIGALRLQTRSSPEEPFSMVHGYHIPVDTDSLMTQLQLYLGEEPGRQMELTMRLLRFRIDDEPARPPHHHNHLQGSLNHRGIDYNQADTLHTVSRELSAFEGVLDIDFEIPKLTEGAYRIEVTSEDLREEQRDDQLYRARDFSIMPTGFPFVTNLENMAESLVYIARRDEHRQIMGAAGTDSLRYEFDKFFAELFNNRNTARNVIHRYFSRVEEANLRFSTHKPGWKTDPGMVYILFGEPDYKEEGLDGKAWNYYQGRSADDHIRFIFERNTSVDRAYPADHYVLRRGHHFIRHYQDMINQWRRGVIF